MGKYKFILVSKCIFQFSETQHTNEHYAIEDFYSTPAFDFVKFTLEVQQIIYHFIFYITSIVLYFLQFSLFAYI